MFSTTNKSERRLRMGSRIKQLQLHGIITSVADLRIVQVSFRKTELRKELRIDEATFSCSISEGSVAIVFSEVSGSKFAIHPDHGRAVRELISKIEESQHIPGFDIGALLDMLA